jgi:acetyl esterase/lipase
MTKNAPRGNYEIDVEDVEYRRDGATALLARLYRPKGSGPFPVMVDLHGGAWCTGDRNNDTKINEALARSGVVVAALDWRMPPVASYPGSLQDIHYAIRWLKVRAPQMKARADRVGVIGISSGGHQGMLLAMRHKDKRYAAIPLPGADGIDARLQCAVLCWPVIDPIGRYRYAKEVQAKGGSYPEEIDRVLPSHVAYWQTEEAMAEGAPATALEAGEDVDLPPTLVVQGTADKMHPRPHLDRFAAAYRARGGAIEVALYEGEAAGFIVRNTKDPANAAAGLERIVAFVHRTLA